MKSPCYKCTERNSTCHSTCEKYTMWVEEIQQRKRQMEIEKLLDGLYREHISKSNYVKRQMKRRGE